MEKTQGNYQEIINEIKKLSLNNQDERSYENFYENDEVEKPESNDNTTSHKALGTTDCSSEKFDSSRKETNNIIETTSTSPPVKNKAKTVFLKPQNEKTIQKGLEEFELKNIIEQKKCNNLQILVKNQYFPLFEKVGLFNNDKSFVNKIININSPNNNPFLSYGMNEDENHINFDVIQNLYSNHEYNGINNLPIEDETLQTLPYTDGEV